MGFETVLFDLDGTLLDTLDDLAASVNHALAAHGFAARTRSQVRAALGNGARRLIADSLPEGAQAETDAVLATFRTHYDLHCCERTGPYPGMRELLDRLRRSGRHTALVSNKPAEAAQALWRHFFSGTIELALGQSPALARKPAPDMPLAALRELGVTPEGAVFVGDSEVDFKTAEAARLPCILVTWGFRDRAQLEALQPLALVDTAAQLEALLL